MANRLGENLAGKVIVMEGDCPAPMRTVKVEDGTGAGFGAFPTTSGTALFVRQWNGKEAVGPLFRVAGYEVDRILADSQI